MEWTIKALFHIHLMYYSTLWFWPILAIIWKCTSEMLILRMSCIKSPHVSAHFIFLTHLIVSVCRHVPSPHSIVKNVTCGICWHFGANTLADKLFDAIILIEYLSDVVDWKSRNMQAPGYFLGCCVSYDFIS